MSRPLYMNTWDGRPSGTVLHTEPGCQSDKGNGTGKAGIRLATPQERKTKRLCRAQGPSRCDLPR